MTKKKKLTPEQERDQLEKIKRLVVIAMFSDNDLMDRFVLKGGSALGLILGVSDRESIDVDLSIEADFSKEEIENVRSKTEKSLQNTFRDHNLEVFDVTLKERPENLTPEVSDFWGGYRIEFKIVTSEDFKEYKDNLENLQRRALMIGPRGKFQIDISKFEYCAQKEPKDLDGYRIFVYTPAMMVCEKLRAICQQLPEYAAMVKKSRTARARDFFDIYGLMNSFSIDLASSEVRELLTNIFKAKEVPLRMLGIIDQSREFHRENFQSVKDTVRPPNKIEEFDFYFDFVITQKDLLKTLWDI